jgi:ABC-type uncharacterized transport system permease subunit
VANADTDRRSRPKFVAYLVPLSAVLVALAVGAIMLGLLGANPIEGFQEMFKGAFGSKDALVETALKATPLLFVGVGITIAFRANVINIGGEGQMVAGGLLATTMALVLPDLPARDSRWSGVGSRAGCSQGLLQRQRDPQHDHVERRRRPVDELPVARATH